MSVSYAWFIFSVIAFSIPGEQVVALSSAGVLSNVGKGEGGLRMIV